MAWQSRSRRRTELPTDWPRIRRAVLERDHYRCTIRDRRCTGHATDVDHINAGNDHTPANLRAACQPCHMARTARQGHAAQPTRTRPAASHPGLL